MTHTIRPASPGDAPLVFAMIRELGAYERLSHEIDATPEMIAEALFGETHVELNADVRVLRFADLVGLVGGKEVAVGGDRRRESEQCTHQQSVLHLACVRMPSSQAS